MCDKVSGSKRTEVFIRKVRVNLEKLNKNYLEQLVNIDKGYTDISVDSDTVEEILDPSMDSEFAENVSVSGTKDSSAVETVDDTNEITGDDSGEETEDDSGEETEDDSSEKTDDSFLLNQEPDTEQYTVHDESVYSIDIVDNLKSENTYSDETIDDVGSLVKTEDESSEKTDDSVHVKHEPDDTDHYTVNDEHEPDTEQYSIHDEHESDTEQYTVHNESVYSIDIVDNLKLEESEYNYSD